VPSLLTRTDTNVFDGFVIVAAAFALTTASGSSLVTAASALALFDCAPPSESPSLSTRSSIAVLLGLASVAVASALTCWSASTPDASACPLAFAFASLDWSNSLL
jgi:hypothetical protein